jgi:putative transposase
MDLRDRVVASVVKQGLSRRAAAARFNVGVSTVVVWVKRFLETGSAAPGKMGGHKQRAIRGEHEVWLLQRIDRGGFTLRRLVVELGERGLKTNYRAVWDFMHAHKLSFKKNTGGWRAGPSGRRAKA